MIKIEIKMNFSFLVFRRSDAWRSGMLSFIYLNITLLFIYSNSNVMTSHYLFLGWFSPTNSACITYITRYSKCCGYRIASRWRSWRCSTVSSRTPTATRHTSGSCSSSRGRRARGRGWCQAVEPPCSPSPFPELTHFLSPIPKLARSPSLFFQASTLSFSSSACQLRLLLKNIRSHCSTHRSHHSTHRRSHTALTVGTITFLNYRVEEAPQAASPSTTERPPAQDPRLYY